jgi:hypothetical protein
MSGETLRRSSPPEILISRKRILHSKFASCRKHIKRHAGDNPGEEL